MTEQSFYNNLPELPGVYLMKDKKGKVLYVGKAGNLKRRVASYFSGANNSRIEKLISKIKRIDYRATETVIEALILESELIKKFLPPYNIKEKDDRSFLYFEITKEKFPRVLLTRGRDRKNSSKSKFFGPFVFASQTREAAKILRRIFPWSVHQIKDSKKNQKLASPCFDYQIGLCPGTCIGAISQEKYLKNIKNLELFLSGKKRLLIKKLEKEMKNLSKKLEFEKAAEIRRQLFALKHVEDAVLIRKEKERLDLKNSIRIEAYDISNISGNFAVGSMVVFEDGDLAKNKYRRFKIKTVFGQNDTAMIKEVIRRRFEGKLKTEKSPNLILIDGGKAQVKAVRSVLSDIGLKIPVVGIAKGKKRKKNEFIGDEIPKGIGEKILIMIRDEAHRFALNYHRNLRTKGFFN